MSKTKEIQKLCIDCKEKMLGSATRLRCPTCADIHRSSTRNKAANERKKKARAAGKIKREASEILKNPAQVFKNQAQRLKDRAFKIHDMRQKGMSWRKIGGALKMGSSNARVSYLKHFDPVTISRQEYDDMKALIADYVKERT